MTKTQRRRAARATHGTQETTARTSTKQCRSATVQRLAESVWQQITDTLSGLLRVEIPSPFTDLQLLCPKEAWLVLDLATVHTTSSAASSLRHHISRVLDALSRILVHVEALRPWNDLYEAFWRRVFTSEMYQCDEIDESTVIGFVRFMRAKGTRIAVAWSGRLLDTKLVVEPIRSWLETTEIDADMLSCRSVQVALRFEDCQLTSKTLQEVLTLMKRPEIPDEKRRLLCEPSSLRELSLSGNILQAHDLRKLTMSILDPTARRIDGLKLDSTTQGETRPTRPYATAFRELMSALYSTPAIACEASDPGVALSLENLRLYAVHIDAVAEAMIHATRPLRGLSLACCYLLRRNAFVRLGRFLSTPLHAATSELDLNMSCVRGEGYADDVGRLLHDGRKQVIDAALAANQRVVLRPRANATVYNGDILDVELSTSQFYEVQDVIWCVCCRIVVSDAAHGHAGVTGNVEPDDVAEMRYGDVTIRSPGFTGLIIDRCTRHDRDHTSDGYLDFSAVADLASYLRRLSVRHNPTITKEVYRWCDELQELNAEGCWGGDASSPRTFTSIPMEPLEVLNVSSCGLDASLMQTFLALPKLRSLQTRSNPVGEVGVRALLDKLIDGSSLEFVDIRHVAEVDSPSHEALGTRLDALVRHERVSPQAIGAFLAVLRDRALAGDVVACILSFVDTKASRVVLW